MPPVMAGHSNMPPEARAIEISIQLSIKNFTFYLWYVLSLKR